MIQALKDYEYDGWLVVEQDTTPGDPTRVARENRIYIEATPTDTHARLIDSLRLSQVECDRRA